MTSPWLGEMDDAFRMFEKSVEERPICDTHRLICDLFAATPTRMRHALVRRHPADTSAWAK
jgi:hypothetical protein